MNTQTVRALAPAKVLVVDDDDDVRRVVARLLRASGHVVTEVSGGDEALKALDTVRFDAICSDIHMPGLGGIALLHAIRDRDLDVPVLLMTGDPTLATAMEAVRYGAIDYLTKPIERERLGQAVLRAVGLGRIARAKRAAMADLVHIHGAGDRAGLEASFESAMRSLWMAYQPIVSRDGALYGHEALLRCREPALPHPGAVLDAAEKLGRLHLLGRRVRALSAEPVAADLACGWLFVNLHPHDLFDEELTHAGSPLGAIAGRVVLEITERASIEKLDDVRARIAELRSIGYRIAIDDLGAGYAGLTAFAVLEPDVVKLDMTLVRNVETSKTKQRLVESLTSVSRDLGMLIVAEGVETEGELDCVLTLGCDLVQGYLLARPGPAFPGYEWPPRRTVAAEAPAGAV